MNATRREPSDFGGYVISTEDFRSVRKEPISIEWSSGKNGVLEVGVVLDLWRVS